VGHGILSIGAGEAHVLNVCVRPEYRCRGVGRRLLDHLLDRGRSAGMLEAFLEVRPSNTSAIRLYQAMGFEQIGIRRGYYQAAAGREDAAVLKRRLAPR
jgi:ribosomal-protein-alanine N-acetyltransferase